MYNEVWVPPLKMVRNSVEAKKKYTNKSHKKDLKKDARKRNKATKSFIKNINETGSKDESLCDSGNKESELKNMIEVNDSNRGDSTDFRYQTRPAFTNVAEDEGSAQKDEEKPSKRNCVIL